MNLKTELMQHQVSAVEKLLPSRVGALFMEMGTGKTRTAIELIYKRQSKISNVLWFCPVSLKYTIKYEILKHTDCTCNDIYLFDNKTKPKSIPKAFFYIIGIESMSSSARLKLSANSIINSDSCVIVDESTYIKGHNSVRTCWITDISERAKYRMILTGTPMTQGVVDLFAQMRFLSTKILGYRSFYSFATNHLEYSSKFPDMIIRAHNTGYLAAKIQPYVYQVTKAECLTLPSKLYETGYFGMTDSSRMLYETAKNDLLLNIDYDNFKSYTIFYLFTVLQRIVSNDDNRYEKLLNIIPCIPNDKKIIIFCKYVNSLEKIVEKLNRTGGGVSKYYGNLTEKERDDEIKKFKTVNRFFVATPSSAGHGLTLTEASHVIFFDNGFKYSERLQAEDRCHRIGQTEKVTYIDIHCYRSIDDKISEALASKGSLIKDFKNKIDKIKDGKKLKEKEFEQLVREL